MDVAVTACSARSTGDPAVPLTSAVAVYCAPRPTSSPCRRGAGAREVAVIEQALGTWSEALIRAGARTDLARRPGARAGGGLPAEGAKELVVIEHGTVGDPELFDALVGRSVNLGEVDVSDAPARRPQSAWHHEEGEFELYRVGRLASRHHRAAVVDSYRLRCRI